MKLIHKGSTKDVYQAGEHYLFHFSNRYSVFDWGEMPDELNDKGLSLARFTKYLYGYLATKDIPTHLLNLPTQGHEMAIKPFKVLRDSKVLPREENLFIPLEVIFRLGVASGSSLLKRGSHFKEGERFAGPMIEFTTKLERFDRPLTHEEARALTGMNDTEWSELIRMTTLISRELEALFKVHNVILWDGKVEFALGEFIGENRQIVLVDSIGPDELRLTKNNIQLSKEILRQFYRRSSWYEKLDQAKAEHGENFKKHLPSPDPLPAKLKQDVEEMYRLLPDLIENLPGSEAKLEQIMIELKGSL